VVDFALLGNNVCLNRRIGGDAAAIYARRVAHVPCVVQRSFRRSLERDSKLYRDAEAFAIAVDEVAEADSHHGRDLIEINLALGIRRIRDIAEVLMSAQREAAAPRYECSRGNGVSYEREHSRADVKASHPREKVVVGLDGAEAQVTVVGHAVFAEVAAVTHDVEAGAHVAAVGHTRGDFSADAKQSRFDAEPDCPLISAGPVCGLNKIFALRNIRIAGLAVKAAGCKQAAG